MRTDHGTVGTRRRCRMELSVQRYVDKVNGENKGDMVQEIPDLTSMCDGGVLYSRNRLDEVNGKGQL